MRSAFILSILLFLVCSCGKKTSEEVNGAIDLAQSYLSDSKCEKAIEVLESVGRDRNNADYLQVLASAYSCRAGYSDIVFLKTELSKINTGAAGLMKSLTQLTWSPENASDSIKYKALREGLNILLNVDSNQPSQVAREAKFGPRDAGDMGVQLLLLNLVQLGKFLHFYGNVNSNGEKGKGAASVDEQTATPSNCFVTYAEARALTFLNGGSGGICKVANGIKGHPNMSFGAADLAATKKRMCEGLMIVTNIIDVLDHLTFAPGSSLAALNAAAASVDAMKATIIAADASLTTLIETTSQNECEILVTSGGEFNNLQYLYALLFEVGLQ